MIPQKILSYGGLNFFSLRRGKSLHNWFSMDVNKHARVCLQWKSHRKVEHKKISSLFIVNISTRKSTKTSAILHNFMKRCFQLAQKKLAKVWPYSVVGKVLFFYQNSLYRSFRGRKRRIVQVVNHFQSLVRNVGIKIILDSLWLIEFQDFYRKKHFRQAID